MIYSSIYFKRSNLIPLFVLMGCSMVFLIAILLGQPQSNKGRVTKKSLLSYELVNISAHQAGIFWETQSPEEGWVELPGGQMIYDERDVANGLQKYSYHYVLLRNLNENTNYQFSIFNNEGKYKHDNKVVFQVKTPVSMAGNQSGKPAYGKVIEPNGSPGKGVFVELKVRNTLPLLVLTKDTGEWLLSLSPLIDATSYKIISDPSESLSVQMTYYDENKRSSNVVSTLSQITPMAQTIILGSNYNLLAQGDVLSATTQVSSEPKLPLSVIYPRENAIIPAGKPLFKGLGIPNSDVFIFINSHPQFAYRTKVDSKGEWRVLPTQSIGPGSYVVAVTSQDGRGGKITINRNFMIAKSGEQVLGEATGPATITPTVPVPTPTVIIASPTPLIIASVVTPTVYTTSIPGTIVPTNAPPTTGGNINYLLFTSIIFIAVGLGFMFVF